MHKATSLTTMIESNCECLNHIRKCIRIEDQLERDRLPMVDSYQQKANQHIHQRNFIGLLIEFAYLLYSCRPYHVRPNIGLEDLRVQAMPNMKWTIVVYYQLGEVKDDQNTARNTLKFFYQYLFSVYAKWPTEPTNNTKEYIDQIKLFQAQFQTLERETAKGIEVAERDYFVLLESTDLFRNYGMLLQIKNSSVVELITGSSEMIGKFKQARKQDEILSEEFSKERKNPQRDEEKLRHKQLAIYANLSAFLKHLSSGVFEVLAERENFFQLQFILKPSLKCPFNTMLEKCLTGSKPTMEQQSSSQKNNQVIFHIEYSNHSLLTVRLLACNLFANVYVYDFLSYQTGMLMCSSVNASIELSGVNGLACLDLKDNKIISFKCSTYFKAKDPTLETLLRLMDNLVIAYRVYEPELQMTSNVISVRDAVRLRTVDRKIQHYSNMLLKYSRKVYK